MKSLGTLTPMSFFSLLRDFELNTGVEGAGVAREFDFVVRLLRVVSLPFSVLKLFFLLSLFKALVRGPL